MRRCPCSNGDVDLARINLLAAGLISRVYRRFINTYQIRYLPSAVGRRVFSDDPPREWI